MLAIVGLIALLCGVCELIAHLLPKRLIDEFAEAYGDVPAPRHDPVVAARKRGAL